MYWSLSQKEDEGFSSFYQKHCCPGGGCRFNPFNWLLRRRKRIWLEVSPEGGIGLTVVVHCSCGAKEDLTDINCW